MKIISPVFEYGASIPPKYTCEGENISPPFQISDFPFGTISVALVFEDPDAPSGTFEHWIGWNIAPKAEFEEGAKLPTEGTNGFGKQGYSGPCPPPGREHRYYLRIFALDSYIQLDEGSKKAQLYQTIKEHIIGEAELMGTYQRVK